MTRGRDAQCNPGELLIPNSYQVMLCSSPSGLKTQLHRVRIRTKIELELLVALEHSAVPQEAGLEVPAGGQVTQGYYAFQQLVAPARGEERLSHRHEKRQPTGSAEVPSGNFSTGQDEVRVTGIS